MPVYLPSLVTGSLLGLYTKKKGSIRNLRSHKVVKSEDDAALYQRYLFYEYTFFEIILHVWTVSCWALHLFSASPKIDMSEFPIDVWNMKITC